MEYKVYLLSQDAQSELEAAHPTFELENFTEEIIKSKAEEKGTVYSLEGFENAFNFKNEFNSKTDFIKIYES